MKRFKKFLSVLMIVAIMASYALVNASAADYNKTDLVNYLTKEFNNKNKNIDISKYKIPRSKHEEIYDLIEAEIPTIFCASEYIIYSQNGMCKHIEVEYIDKAKYNTMLKQFNNNTEYLIRDLNTNRLSDEDKVLLIHDRLIAWCEYDYTNYYNKTITTEDCLAFGAIVNRKAVCAGYSRAFIYLMKKVGISCEYVSSDVLNHAWNIVTINGKRYHVDLTWDDTRCVGEVDHDNLLLSTKGIISTQHTANDFDSTPYDTTYDNYYWQKSNAGIQYYGGALYYINKETGDIIKRINGTESVITTINSKWINAETGGKYSYCYAKLCSDNDYLYFTDIDSVYSIDSSGNIEKVWSPDIPKGMNIYGFSTSNGSFNIYCYENAKFNESSKSGYILSHQFKSEATTTEKVQENTVTASEAMVLNPGFNFFELLSSIIQILISLLTLFK